MTTAAKTWSVLEVKGSFQVPFHITDETGRTVAHVTGDQLNPRAQSISEAREAARLIASAPALLESIDQVCAALETLMAQHGDSMCDADRRSRCAALGAARRAQANAEGFATWEDAVNAWSSDE